jgi:hypothetical protein
MATLWPTLANDDPRATGEVALLRALGHAVTLAEGGAGVLALREDGDDPNRDHPRKADDDNATDTLICWNIPLDAGRHLVALRRSRWMVAHWSAWRRNCGAARWPR